MIDFFIWHSQSSLRTLVQFYLLSKLFLFLFSLLLPIDEVSWKLTCSVHPLCRWWSDAFELFLDCLDCLHVLFDVKLVPYCLSLLLMHFFLHFITLMIFKIFNQNLCLGVVCESCHFEGDHYNGELIVTYLPQLLFVSVQPQL